MRPAGSSHPDPLDSAYVSERLTALTHELANLLDGSLRCLSLARRAVWKTGLHAPAGDTTAQSSGAWRSPGANTRTPSDDLAATLCEDARDSNSAVEVARLLDTVHVAMQQMASLVKASMGGFTPGLMAPVTASIGSGGGMSEAVRHAADVMSPVAEELRIELTCEIDPRLAEVPAGPVYTIITNAVRNAIESIERLQSSGVTGTGAIRVQARLDNRSSPDQIEIEIIDDGQGPPARIEGGTNRLFDAGVTTKPNGSGIGLSVIRDVVDELGGTVALSRRTPDPCTHRAGAVLSVRFPCPATFGQGER